MEITSEDRDAVRIVTMSGSDGLNVLTDEAHRDLEEHLVGADDDDGVRVIILKGTPRSFSVGADIDAFPDPPADPTVFVTRFLLANALPERLSKPVFAVVEGIATAGGFELALACDWIFAGPKASFSLPEARFGLVAGYAAVRLMDTVGMQRARRLLMSGESLGAYEAAAYGLPVTAAADPLGAALALSRDVSLAAPQAVRIIKQRSVAHAEARDPRFRDGLASYAELWNLPDTREAISAWRGRRAPMFRPASDPWQGTQLS